MAGLLRKISWCIVIVAAVWLGGLCWFVGQIPVAPQTAAPANGPVDAIIVLTGGANRLDAGIGLLMKGQGRTLFITGVSDNLSLPDLLHNVSPASRAFAQGEGAASITLGHQAGNTIGNALETRQWLALHHYHAIRLVTANYHMPRSLEEFRAAMPDIAIIPEPVFPDDFTIESWWQSTYGRHVILSEYHKFIASTLRHWYVKA